MRWNEITEKPHQRRTVGQKVTAEELQEKCPVAWDNYE